MANLNNAQSIRLHLENLEGRDIPSASPWILDTFESQTVGQAPSGWQQNLDDGQGFTASQTQALGSRTSLISEGSSSTEARAWIATPFDANVESTAAVYLGSTAPALVFSRGVNLESATPSYYGVSVTPSGVVQLVRVVDGELTVLASVESQETLHEQWAQVTLSAVNDQLQVTVFRTDTAQYLSSTGTWQSTPTRALSTTDSQISDGGFVGIARPTGYSGQAIFDNFHATEETGDALPSTLHSQSFNSVSSQGVPDGWNQWTNDTSGRFDANQDNTLIGSNSLSVNALSSGIARTWFDTTLPADVQVSTGVYLDSLIPAQLFARGQNLDSATPTYYAVALSRGLSLQLLRVVDGETTVLADLGTEGWQTKQWVQVSLALDGDKQYVQVYRPDTAQYLNLAGQWQVLPTWAIEGNDKTIQKAGRAGVGRSSSYAGELTFDNFFVTTGAKTRSVDRFTFDQEVRGTLPGGWTHWTNNVKGGFQISGLSATSQGNLLASSGTGDTEARLWLARQYPQSVQISGNVFVSNSSNAEFLLRGQNLDQSNPSYYSLSISRDSNIELRRIVNDESTILASVQSSSGVLDQWLQVRFEAKDDGLQATIVRADTGEFLNSDGQWQVDDTYAIFATDDALQGSGYAGLVRSSGGIGRVLYDDVSVSYDDSVTPVTPPVSPPPPVVVPPPPVVVTPPVVPPPPVVVPPVVVSPPVVVPPVTPPVVVSPPVVVVPPVVVTPPVTPPTVPPAIPSSLPNLPRHYSHIRIAQLAYTGTPFGDFETNLLRESIDLVIPNTAYLDQINDLNPDTAQLIYSNVSNIYLGLYTDWLKWADANGVNREDAFFHVSEASAFTGASASSMPVNYFWSILKEQDGDWKDVTRSARLAGETVEFGSRGESVAIGNTEKFREINLRLQRGAGAGWNSVVEYVSAVDAQGNPTHWSTLNINRDTTGGMTHHGQLIFDPPTNWKAASLNGSDPFYYVRIRTTGFGRAPVSTTILGRDYVNANGREAGVTPAFDSLADRDGDGYLNDSEFARRRSGFDARFTYESRLFYPVYGQQRFATNVTSAAFREWAADYTYRFLEKHPHAEGVFLDNSLGRLAVNPATVLESMETYTADYGRTLQAVNTRIAPKWVLANTAGGGQTANPGLSYGISYLEEFAIRPLRHNHVQFEDLAAQVEQRMALSNGKALAVLDSHTMGGEAEDPRTQLATLAYYYLIGDPEQTALLYNGGNEPNTTWQRHWIPAAAYDVGQPVDEWSVFATGQDPSNRTLTYKVYEREYDHALVLYKPLSYYRNQTGTTHDRTATGHDLNGVYRPLRADGTLGAPVTRVSIRNGEGMVLIKVA